jgi:hypothetical protein
MSIVFLASDASELGGTWVNTAIGGEFDANYTDKAFGFTSASGTNVYGPFPAMFSVPALSGDLWLHYRHKMSSGASVVLTTTFGSVIEFINAAGQIVALLDSRGASTGNGWRVEARGDTTVQGSAFAAPYGSTSTFDIQVTVNSTNIIINCYNNGSLVSTATAANSTGLKGKPRIVHLAFDSTQYRSSGSTLNSFSEMVATDGESTIGWRIGAGKPTGNGANTAWTGTYTDLSTVGDGAMISDANVGDKESWTITAYGGPATPASIRGVVVKYAASKGTTGPQNIEPLVRLSSTDYLKSPVAPDNVQPVYADWTVNPATSAPWNTTDFTGMEIGVRAAT